MLSLSSSLVTGSSEKQNEASSSAAAADGFSQKQASHKPGPVNIVTRRLRFQAKPNISKNARTRSLQRRF